MEINVTIKRKTLVAALSGELDHHTAKDVKDLIENVIKNRDVKNLVFDFSDLTFMDSSGIGVVLGRYKLIHSMGGKVAIVAPSKAVSKLLAMSGINKLTEICDTAETALKILQEEIS